MKHELKSLKVFPRFAGEDASRMFKRLRGICEKSEHNPRDWSLSRIRRWSGFTRSTKPCGSGH